MHYPCRILSKYHGDVYQNNAAWCSITLNHGLHLSLMSLMVILDLAYPTNLVLSGNKLSLKIAHNVGYIFFFAKSPEAPKTTKIWVGPPPLILPHLLSSSIWIFFRDFLSNSRPSSLPVLFRDVFLFESISTFLWPTGGEEVWAMSAEVQIQVLGIDPRLLFSYIRKTFQKTTDKNHLPLRMNVFNVLSINYVCWRLFSACKMMKWF